MDFKKVEFLLKRYDRGETTRSEELELRTFFENETVPEHWAHYKLLFSFFQNENQIESNHTFTTPRKTKFRPWMSIAAAAVVTIGVFFQQYESNRQKQEAQKAFAQTFEILNLVSEQMTKSTAKLSYIKTFSDTTNQFIKQ